MALVRRRLDAGMEVAMEYPFCPVLRLCILCGVGVGVSNLGEERQGEASTRYENH